MKNFFGKVKKLIWNHKLLALICLLASVLVIILIGMFIWMTVSGNNAYGSRLDGIEEVEISKKKLKEVATKLEENNEIKDATVRIQGKIIYFTIHYNQETSKDRAKELANSILGEFSDEEKSFYDLEYILVEDRENKEETGYVITGAKQNNLDSITWSKS